MRVHRKVPTALAVCACGASLAISGVSAAHPPASHAQKPASQPKAYGKLCQGESKQHVKGQKGTPFSQCVTAMAHLAKGTSKSPAKACSTLSKKHVKGQRRTPYAACVVAGAQLLKTAHT
jgi:hypothetical protein